MGKRKDKRAENTAHERNREIQSELIRLEGAAGEREKSRAGRVILVALTLLLTMVLALAAGVMIALIDLEKTPADLLYAWNGTDVERAVAQARAEYEEIYASAQDKVTADLDPAVDEIPVLEVLGEDEEVAEKERSNTEVVSSEVAGINSVLRAGTNDIIVYQLADHRASAGGTQVITDPNADFPLPFSTVDLSYFDDALFIGDSRMLGFGMYSGLTNATFYAVTSFSLFRYETMPVVQTENGKVPIFTALPYDRFTKIYIKVGLNELGGSEGAFLQVYDEFVQKLREMEPRAIIYTHAILPVTAEKSTTDFTHSNENINRRNATLKQYAEENKCYFIDIAPVVSQEDGSLMPEMTGDGIHLKAGYMELWKEYLRTHAVVFQS